MENENIDMNKIIGSVDLTEQPDVMDISIVKPFVKALKSLSIVISNHSGYTSIALTESDCNELEEGLTPLKDWLAKALKYMVYFPIIVFAIGYSFRIYDEASMKAKIKAKDDSTIHTTDSDINIDNQSKREVEV